MAKKYNNKNRVEMIDKKFIENANASSFCTTL